MDKPPLNQRPNFNPSEIYPEDTSQTAPGPVSRSNAGKPEAKLRQHSLIGVPVIAAIALFYGGYYAWIYYRDSDSVPQVILALSIFQIILGLGLLARREIARITAVILEAISLVLSFSSLLGSTTLEATGVKTTQVVGIVVNLVVILYLTRPTVREYFD